MKTSRRGSKAKNGNGSRKAAGLALAVLAERIHALPKADRDDLYELSKVWIQSDSEEEIESAEVAMREIIDQAPVRVMALTVPEKPSPGLQKWIDFAGDKIRAEREKAQLTQSQLAERAGLPQSHISRLERGQHSPSHHTLEKIARALRIPVARLDPSA